MTSALYPYVHTQACGMSAATYSLGQKRAGSDRDGDADLVGSSAGSVPVADDRPVRRLNKELRPLDFFVTSLLLWLLPWLTPAVVSQVPRG
jgi:hypothetical protein